MICCVVLDRLNDTCRAGRPSDAGTTVCGRNWPHWSVTPCDLWSGEIFDCGFDCHHGQSACHTPNLFDNDSNDGWALGAPRPADTL